LGVYCAVWAPVPGRTPLENVVSLLQTARVAEVGRVELSVSPRLALAASTEVPRSTRHAPSVLLFKARFAGNATVFFGTPKEDACSDVASLASRVRERPFCTVRPVRAVSVGIRSEIWLIERSRSSEVVRPRKSGAIRSFSASHFPSCFLGAVSSVFTWNLLEAPFGAVVPLLAGVAYRFIFGPSHTVVGARGTRLSLPGRFDVAVLAFRAGERRVLGVGPPLTEVALRTFQTICDGSLTRVGLVAIFWTGERS